ncbi:MAG: uroporphyrinogen decarboxylase family protein, partial [Chloroflexota bacterium]|nr:uroporphyrinogen decarboxylase family protein [Chloroflexota bacterium]
GTPSDVEAEVKLRIDHLAPSGGYVLAAVHTIMEETPPENVAAMLNTAYRYRPGGR